MRRLGHWGWLLLIVPLLAGVARLRLDVEILNLLPAGLPVVEGLKLHLKHFSDARELIIAVEASDAESTESTARALAQMLREHPDLVDAVIWQPGWMGDPRDAMEIVAYTWMNQPPTLFGAWTNQLAPAHVDERLAETRERLATSLSPADLAIRSRDPFGFLELPESSGIGNAMTQQGQSAFASEDGRFRIVFVEAHPDLGSYRACRAWVAGLRAVISEGQRSGRLPAGARFRFTGRPAFVDEISGGMESDMAGSAGGTLAIIGILFWLTHRRLRPLLWLLALLLAILAGTAALGGLVFGQLNVVSLGFASILLGLAEDFGIVIYQELRSNPGLDTASLRRAVAPGILWSAATTAGAFLALNLSSLPGLARLGTLVAFGVLLATVVMLYAFLPGVHWLRRDRDKSAVDGEQAERFLLFNASRVLPAGWVWGISGVLLVTAAILLVAAGPQFDRSPNVLKPRRSEATETMEAMKRHLGRGREPMLVLVRGTTADDVGRRLAAVASRLEAGVSNGAVARYVLPTSLWPSGTHQLANRPVARWLADQRTLLRDAASRAGFTEEAFLLTDGLFAAWSRGASATNEFWPSSPMSRWIFGKFAARSPDGFIALGSVWPSTNRVATSHLVAEWEATPAGEGASLTGWELLGSTVFERVMKELPAILFWIALIVVATLWLAFRNWREVVLSLLTLGFSAALLGAVMIGLGLTWNLLNLMALPLLLGMGVDFSIHVQLAMRHHRGDRLAVRQSVGRALLLAGATTIAGFGSLGFSTNAGMGSLGIVCALGIGIALLTAVGLLPVWWTAFVSPSRGRSLTLTQHS